FFQLIRSVFPDVGTRRLGKRGNARYHYDGIDVKENSSFYQLYCSLQCKRVSQSHCSPGEVSRSDLQLSTSAGTCGNTRSSLDASGYRSNSLQKTTNLHCSPSIIYLKNEQERFQYLWTEFSGCYLLEQEIGNQSLYKTVAPLANEYSSYCQVILHLVRNGELDKVDSYIMSFWRSLQPEKITLMFSPDVCQLLSTCDRDLFKV
ncbi:DNA-binding protein RFX8, partial [Colius striatus]